MTRRTRPGSQDSRAAARRAWYLLIHQLPPEPLYLRAKIRQRLTKVGAVALKNAVYALPRTEDCLEDFQWIAQEAISGGGDAHVCEAEFLEKRTDQALIERFRAERDADYEDLAASIRAEGRGENPSALLARSRRRLEEIARIDFFEASRRREVEGLLQKTEAAARPRRERSGASGRKRSGGAGRLSNRTWVTRQGIKVDRISTAWLIRRFVDPRAKLRFVDPSKEGPAKGELAFDLVGGDFTHEGDRCTFETLRRRAGLRDPALGPVGEIVHDIDLKDGKFGRPETRGIERVLSGILRSCPGDEERLERGFQLFDGLYESFRRRPGQSRKGPKS
jgi:hypothetical protein